MNKVVAALCVALGASSTAIPVSAHHGAALFEDVKTVTVTGTVTDFQFVNPHVLVYLTVKGEDGSEARWGGELTSPNRLARMDGAVKWHKGILKPGDTITMTGHPARNGAPAMHTTKIVDAHGAVLIDG
jgi:uncharacterized protein DUF6152